jgi:hypothetical protein
MVCEHNFKIYLLLPASVTLCIAILGAFSLTLLSGCVASSPSHSPEMPSSQQAMIHHKGHQVMPFDLSKTRHIFEMTVSGGIQEVIAKDSGDTKQIALIRKHLQHEAMRFSRGDYSDPAMLHGAAMPGLKELTAGAINIRVEYSALPNGAQIIFTTQDIHLTTAIHRWFGAQLSDHGADATYR